ncbi:MAG: zinc ribbon domain-containing protein [Aureliella sp.]
MARFSGPGGCDWSGYQISLRCFRKARIASVCSLVSGENREYITEKASLASDWPSSQSTKRSQASHGLSGDVSRHIGGADVRNKFGALLKGQLRCSACDCAISPSHTTKKKARRYRYYVCSSAQKRSWHTCPSKSMPPNRTWGGHRWSPQATTGRR